MYIVIYHFKEYVMVFQKNIKLLKCRANCRFYTSSPGIYLTPLVPYVSMIETDCDLVVWFSLSCSFTFKGDVLFGAIYLPPENSKYAFEDPFVVLQNI